MPDDDPYAKKLADLYAMSEEEIKANADMMKRWDEAVPVPSQEELDEVIAGYPKRKAAKAGGTPVEDSTKKAMAADKPARAYKTRTIDSGDSD